MNTDDSSSSHVTSTMDFATRSRRPLGLPTGSVRAILTLIIVAVVIVQALRGRAMTVMLTETLMVALAHYFTTRRLLTIPAAVRRQLEAQGLLIREEHPLYLPRHTIRLLIIAAFVVLAIYLAWTGQLRNSAALGTLGLVLCYFLGVLLSVVIRWYSQHHTAAGRLYVVWEDAKACLVILTTSAYAIVVLLDHAESLPRWAMNAIFGLILFYFGSR